jgi:hypothetical protein
MEAGFSTTWVSAESSGADFAEATRMGVVLCSATGLPSPNTAVRPALQPLYTTRSDSAGHGCRLAEGVTLLGGVSRLVGGLTGLVGGVIPLVRKVARLLPGLIGKMGYHPMVGSV